MRRDKEKPIADALHAWLTAQRQKVPPGLVTARAINYSLNRWAALTRYVGDPRLRARTAGQLRGPTLQIDASRRGVVMCVVVRCNSGLSGRYRESVPDEDRYSRHFVYKPRPTPKY